VKRNVATDVAALQCEKEGFSAWTHEDVAKFEAYWPVGSTPPLALAIMLYTGVRRSDAVLLGPPMVLDRVHAPEDAEAEEGADHTGPARASGRDRQDADHRDEDLPRDAAGKSVHAAGFGNWFREKCDVARLKECTARGIRKVAAETAAENGATEKEMMDIFRWTKADLAAYYARKANRRRSRATPYTR
jgi:hypothetical protein